VPRPAATAWLLAREARALLTRLARIRPFALQEPMLPAAALSARAQTAIEDYLAHGRSDLRRQILAYLAWLQGSEGQAASAELQHRRYVALRLGFNRVLSEFDEFSDAITQRSEHDTGLWIAASKWLQRTRWCCRDTTAIHRRSCVISIAGPAVRSGRARTRARRLATTLWRSFGIPRERMIGSGVHPR